MINSYGAKAAYAKTSELPKINVNQIFGGVKAKENQIEKWKSFSWESDAIKNTLVNRLLAGASAENFTRLIAQIQKVSFGAGDVIYQPNGVDDYIYFPETAVFSQLNILEDGRTVETAMIGSEGVIGLPSILGLRQANFWTQALAAGSAFKIRADIFKQHFAGGGFLQTAFLEYVNFYIKQISQRAVCNNHHRIEERFSTWLLMLDDRLGTDEKNKLRLTQEQIAQMLGVHRPSVTCIAQDLRDKGIIDYLRGKIFILDRQNLETSACECYSAIR